MGGNDSRRRRHWLARSALGWLPVVRHEGIDSK